MPILIVGLSHKTAPVEIREKLSFPTGKLRTGLTVLKEQYGLIESVIISTCNRVEIYGVVKKTDDGISCIKRFLSDHHTIRAEMFEKYLYTYTDEEAVRHLLNVTASLDSMVIGEGQILGQVKEAYYHALEARATGTVFNGLFHRVITAAKKVRTETEIGRKPASVSSVTVDLARKIFGELKGHTVMLIGAGKMSELTAQYLVDSGVRSVFVSNRTYDKACALAKTLNGEAVKFDVYLDYMVHADIVISSTGAPHYIIRRPEVVDLIRKRKNKPMFFIDISVPRNIDPNINTIDNVYVYNIDDLQGVAESNKKVRDDALCQAEQIIGLSVKEIMAWYNSLNVVPTIISLQKKIELLRREELSRSIAKLKNMSEQDKQQVDQLTRSLVNKVLSTPITRLKERSEKDGAYQYIESLQYLFKLEDSDNN